jgi:bifunctional UDP-N-acetylglucosamine pyrophosphorylase/glucosamine-1-phosphate N-acetyltransferase
MLDPRQTFIDVTVQLGHDITIYPGTILQGSTMVANGCDIGPDTQLTNCTVGTGSVVRQTVATDVTIGDHTEVGPFAYLGPGSNVVSGTITGPFYTAPVGD